MKKLIIPGLFLFCLSPVFGQMSYTRIYDPSIVAQEKRQVFSGGWGDWRPYPKYFLGVQTNFSYATVWGMWAPKINRDYKNGADIRPLKPNGGQEVQRQLLTLQQEKQAEQIGIRVDSLHSRNMADLAYWTSATVSADPLWLLYFKRRLKPLNDFPEKPSNYLQWQLPNDDVYQELQSLGIMNEFQEKLDILKDKYYTSRNVDMPRGKRFILYTEIYRGWRDFLAKLKMYQQKTTFAIDYANMLKNLKLKKKNINSRHRSDEEIVAGVMSTYQNKY